MPSIIDALLVTLGLDTSDYEKGAKRVNAAQKGVAEEAVKSGGAAEKAAKKQAEAMAKLRGEVIGLLAAYAGVKSITSFVTANVQATAAAGRTGQVLGMSANTVNAWGVAIKGAGGSASEAAGIFGKLADIRADWVRHPENLNMQLMAQLGIHKKSDLDNDEETLYNLADQYQKEMAGARASGKPGEEQQVAANFRQAAKEFLGLSDETLAMIERGRGPMREQIEYQKEHNKITVEDAEAARRSIQSMENLRGALDGLGRSAAITGTIEVLTDLINLLDGQFDGLSKGSKNVALGFWALTHPLTTLLNMMASVGLIDPKLLQGLGLTAPDWMTSPGAAGPPGSLGSPQGATPSGYSGGGGGNTKADRNNNPGNIKGVNDQGKPIAWVQNLPGFAGLDGSFAKFATPEAGWAAADKLAGNKINKLGSVAAIISSWAPASDHNNTAAYIAAVSKEMGVGAYDRLTPDKAHALAMAIARHEGYHGGTTAAARPAGKGGKPVPHMSYPGLSEQQLYRMAAGGSKDGGNVVVHVNAQGAHDPHKVATLTGHAVKQALRKRQHVANANTGVQ